MFCEYYLKQGIEHFYLYYNGTLGIENSITSAIIDICNKPYITLREWEFPYWLNPGTHHAQIGQIHHALNYYNANYMLFCDLDEYIHVSGAGIIKDLIYQFGYFNSFDAFAFMNCWSKTEDSQVPMAFPTSFLINSQMNKYPIRSKCLYKVSSVDLIGIHYTPKIKVKQCGIICHFFEFSQPNRKITGNFLQRNN
jgi:hypothetical protein